MSRPDHEPPQFAAALRGYDRDQVDDYIATLQGFLQEAQDRALEAEQATLTVPTALPPAGSPASAAVVAEEITDALSMSPTARAVQGLPQRLADAVREAVAAAERAGALLVADVEQERAALTEGARAAREQAGSDAERVVAEARAEADRLLRDASAHAQQLRWQTDEENRRRQAIAEEQLTAIRQRADQEQARRDHTLRQIDVLRQSLEAASRPDTGGLAAALFGPDPEPAPHVEPVPHVAPTAHSEPVAHSDPAPAGEPAPRAEPDRSVDLSEPASEPSDGPHEAVTEVIHLDRPRPDAAAADEDADPYGDRTQVLRVVE